MIRKTHRSRATINKQSNVGDRMRKRMQRIGPFCNRTIFDLVPAYSVI